MSYSNDNSNNVFSATFAPSNSVTVVAVDGAASPAPAESGRFGLIQDQQTLVIAILVGLMCCVIAILIGVLSPYFFPQWDHPLQAISTGRNFNTAEPDPERIKRRHTTITNWLITKVVQPHDGYCHHATTLSPPPSPVKRIQYDDDQDDNEQPSLVKDIDGNYQQRDQQHENDPVKNVLNDPIHVDDSDDDLLLNTSCTNNFGYECHICMEEFRVNDAVSWGSSCNHVYHHNCIQEWLLKKRDCPDCRSTMLPIDVPGVLRLSTTTSNNTTTRRNNDNDNNGSHRDGIQINNNNNNLRNDCNQHDNEEHDTHNSQIMNNLMQIKQEREDSTFFCFQHGLQVSKRVPKSKTDSTSTIAQVSVQGDTPTATTEHNGDETDPDTHNHKSNNDEIERDQSGTTTSGSVDNGETSTTNNNHNNDLLKNKERFMWVIEPPIEDRRRSRPEPPIDEENGGDGSHDSNTNNTTSRAGATIFPNIPTMTRIFGPSPNDLQPSRRNILRREIMDAENPSIAVVDVPSRTVVDHSPPIVTNNNDDNFNTEDNDGGDAMDVENHRTPQDTIENNDDDSLS